MSGVSAKDTLQMGGSVRYGYDLGEGAAARRSSTASAVAVERREMVVRRLLERGMPMRALEALLPGWEEVIARVLEIERAKA